MCITNISTLKMILLIIVSKQCLDILRGGVWVFSMESSETWFSVWVLPAQILSLKGFLLRHDSENMLLHVKNTSTIVAQHKENFLTSERVKTKQPPLPPPNNPQTITFHSEISMLQQNLKFRFWK